MTWKTDESHSHRGNTVHFEVLRCAFSVDWRVDVDCIKNTSVVDENIDTRCTHGLADLNNVYFGD